MMAPMLVPTMQSTGMCSFSRASITPTCAAPRAPPPLNTRQTFGRLAWAALVCEDASACAAGALASNIVSSVLVRIARIRRPCGMRAFYRRVRQATKRSRSEAASFDQLTIVKSLCGVCQAKRTRANVNTGHGAHHRQQGLHLVCMGDLHELVIAGESLHLFRVAGIAHAHHLGEQALLDGLGGHLEQFLHGAIEAAHRSHRVGLAAVSLEDGFDVQHGAHLVLEPADAVVALLVGTGADVVQILWHEV